MPFVCHSGIKGQASRRGTREIIRVQRFRGIILLGVKQATKAFSLSLLVYALKGMRSGKSEVDGMVAMFYWTKIRFGPPTAALILKLCIYSIRHKKSIKRNFTA